jgi:hypothetical protein
MKKAMTFLLFATLLFVTGSALLDKIPPEEAFSTSSGWRNTTTG